MRKFKTWMILLCAAPLAACSLTGNASDGAGYAALHPSSATRQFIFANDKPFTKEVAAHNVQCGKDPMCQK